MIEQISDIKTIIESLLSKGGYTVKNICISCDSPVNILLAHDATSGDIRIDFLSSQPLATIQKLIRFSLVVEGVSLGKNNGTLKIKHFPDISFDYDSKAISFGASSIAAALIRSARDVDFSSIEIDINSQYSDSGRRKIAKKCLQYGTEWAMIVGNSGFDASHCSAATRKILKKQCSAFIAKQIKNEEETLSKSYGSIIITILLLNFLLPIIIKWVVEKILNHWLK